MWFKRKALPLALCLLMVLVGVGCFPLQSKAATVEGVNWMVSKDEGIRPGAVDVPILMYHHLVEDENDSTISRDIMWVGQFRRQMELLKDNGYETVSLEQLLALGQEGTPLPEKSVCITFDDGYSSVYELAFPILKEMDLQAIVFPIGVSVGKDTYKDTGTEMIPHFTWAQAAEMEQSGLVSIQSHSFDMHQWSQFETDLTYLRPNAVCQPWETPEEYAFAMEWDMTRFSNDMFLALGERPVAFAYPAGVYSDQSEELLQAAGIQCTFTINGGKAQIVPGVAESLFMLNRFYVTPTTTDVEFLEWLQ